MEGNKGKDFHPSSWSGSDRSRGNSDKSKGKLPTVSDDGSIRALRASDSSVSRFVDNMSQKEIHVSVSNINVEDRQRQSVQRDMIRRAFFYIN